MMEGAAYTLVTLRDGQVRDWSNGSQMALNRLSNGSLTPL